MVTLKDLDDAYDAFNTFISSMAKLPKAAILKKQDAQAYNKKIIEIKKIQNLFSILDRNKIDLLTIIERLDEIKDKSAIKRYMGLFNGISKKVEQSQSYVKTMESA